MWGRQETYLNVRRRQRRSVFDGKNYELWQPVVQTALIAKNKLFFIEGKLQRPEKNSEQEFPKADA